MSATPARMVALEVVSRVRERRAYAHETLAAVLASHDLSAQDTAFATRIAYGTIACRGTLDESLGRFVSAEYRIEPRVADALAVSAFEVLFARTPARAAVSQGVELVRSVQPKASGLANAVLRRLADAAGSFPWGDPETDDTVLARRVGHPLWMTETLIDDLGRERAAAVMAANNEPAPLYLALLPFRHVPAEIISALDRDGAGPQETPLEGCIQCGSPSAAIRSTTVAERDALVADAGAQVAAHLVRPLPGSHIVEIGAGRGTKTLILAALAKASDRHVRITAVDSHQFKVDALADAANDLGLQNVSTLCADATEQLDSAAVAPGSADVVLIDAPCSGLGTLRRHPDRRWRATPDEIEALAVLGGRLLRASAALVKPGGFMVYSTCTITRRENAQVVDAFLASETGRAFTIDSIESDIPAPWRGFVTPEGFFQSLPEIGGMDGHFVARLLRRE